MSSASVHSIHHTADFCTDKELGDLFAALELQHEENERAAWLLQEHWEAELKQVESDRVIARQQQIDEEERLSRDSIPTFGRAISGSFEAPDAVIVEGQAYRPVERGSSHGGHSNTCFYHSVTDGDGAAAVALKQRLAPEANRLARLRREDVDYGGESVCAAEPVFQAAAGEMTVIVADFDANRIVKYQSSRTDAASVYICKRGAHFRRLTKMTA